MSKKLSVQEKARRLWVRALRSKKYKWGKEQLHPTEDKFCCLGVLCEVAIKEGIIDSYNPHGETPPNVVRKWVGLQTKNGDFDTDWKARLSTLTEVNDESKRNPFEKIANMIEKNKKGLFEGGKS